MGLISFKVFFSESNKLQNLVGFLIKQWFLKASPTVGTISSSAAFQLVLILQHNLSRQAPSSQIIGQMDDTGIMFLRSF